MEPSIDFPLFWNMINISRINIRTKTNLSNWVGTIDAYDFIYSTRIIAKLYKLNLIRELNGEIWN